MITHRLEQVEDIIANQELDTRDEYGAILTPELAKRLHDIQWILAVGMSREQYKQELGKRYGLEDTSEKTTSLFTSEKPKLTIKKSTPFKHPDVSIYEIDT